MLVRARRILKYTFAFLYENRDSDNVNRKVEAGNEKDALRNERLLFFSRLDQVLRFTEELSFLSEQPVTQDERTRIINLVRINIHMRISRMKVFDTLIASHHFSHTRIVLFCFVPDQCS